MGLVLESLALSWKTYAAAAWNPNKKSGRGHTVFHQGLWSWRSSYNALIFLLCRLLETAPICLVRGCSSRTLTSPKTLSTASTRMISHWEISGSVWSLRRSRWRRFKIKEGSGAKGSGILPSRWNKEKHKAWKQWSWSIASSSEQERVEIDVVGEAAKDILALVASASNDLGASAPPENFQHGFSEATTSNWHLYMQRTNMFTGEHIASRCEIRQRQEPERASQRAGNPPGPLSPKSNRRGNLTFQKSLPMTMRWSTWTSRLRPRTIGGHTWAAQAVRSGHDGEALGTKQETWRCLKRCERLRERKLRISNFHKYLSRWDILPP